MSYAAELKRSMEWLAEQPDVLFIGQGVVDGGTHQAASFKDITDDRKVEFPVAEELQMGVSIGLALEGYVPVSVYPRWNFLLSATNQLVNHLDRISGYSNYRPKVIVRVAIGAKEPLDPGPQHADNCTDGFCRLLRNVEVRSLGEPGQVLRTYQDAYSKTSYVAGRSFIVVEEAKEAR